MILRRYGETLESVETDFDPNALNEIAFRRDRAFSVPTEAFHATHERVEEHELTSEAEGHVHSEAEQALLDGLEAKLRELEAGLGEGEVLLVESKAGVDYPKTRGRQKKIVVEGENKLYFYASVDPPLRVGTYRRR